VAGVTPERWRLLGEALEVRPSEYANFRPFAGVIDDVIFRLVIVWLGTEELHFDDVEELWRLVVVIGTFPELDFRRGTLTDGTNPRAEGTVREELAAGDTAAGGFEGVGEADEVLGVRLEHGAYAISIRIYVKIGMMILKDMTWGRPFLVAVCGASRVSA
jgi:hypothetical protein